MGHDWSPPPPPPPENRVECSSCGYCASKTKFNELHGKQCRFGIFIIATIVISLVVVFGTIIITGII